ncbi:hypothetical protein [Streptomyces sp. NPDC058678]|uniref:hypothetical protein n=1 Tax=Streptomyces sp. NPDC058678 TaxID=3346595 RepID=UPI00364BE5A5
MPGRFEYERAIRRSDLPPPSRHLALTIATWADMDTGVIPDRFQPSLGTLVVATGLDRKTVRRHLDRLEDEKWVRRDRPDAVKARTEHERTHYALLIPPEARGTEPPASDGPRGTEPPDLGDEGSQAGGTEPPGKGRTSPSPRGGEPPKSSSAVPKSRESQKSRKGPAKPNPHQVADDLTAAFWDHHKSRCTQSFIAVRTVIRTAIGNGIDRDDLAHALDRVAKEGRPVSGGTLQVALQPQQTTGPKPRNERRPDSDYHDEGQRF